MFPGCYQTDEEKRMSEDELQIALNDLNRSVDRAVKVREKLLAACRAALRCIENDDEGVCEQLRAAIAMAEE